MYVLAILTIFFRYSASLITILICFHKILSGPGIDKLLHLLIVLVNFLYKKRDYSNKRFNRISSNIIILTSWFWAELNVWCNAY